MLYEVITYGKNKQEKWAGKIVKSLTKAKYLTTHSAKYRITSYNVCYTKLLRY